MSSLPWSINIITLMFSQCLRSGLSPHCFLLYWFADPSMHCEAQTAIVHSCFRSRVYYLFARITTHDRCVYLHSRCNFCLFFCVFTVSSLQWRCEAVFSARPIMPSFMIFAYLARSNKNSEHIRAFTEGGQSHHVFYRLLIWFFVDIMTSYCIGISRHHAFVNAFTTFNVDGVYLFVYYMWVCSSFGTICDERKWDLYPCGSFQLHRGDCFVIAR